ncbi:hypothetical protein SAMN06265222_111170 [Neorhodopirellula lusitana]|uniref:Uncharacterized protein n=1 Tax=Neorhodopirellula lusitana TaxID=445327 RepID=A0ABY1QGQ5_9BACT|nr:hypothetical protein [Neorhodopirellula lusitana]SMP69077.1 hypothetical protein SAMN06265222_111170 [Neorhodopirellula lusitana]
MAPNFQHRCHIKAYLNFPKSLSALGATEQGIIEAFDVDTETSKQALNNKETLTGILKLLTGPVRLYDMLNQQQAE